MIAEIPPDRGCTGLYRFVTCYLLATGTPLSCAIGPCRNGQRRQSRRPLWFGARSGTAQGAPARVNIAALLWEGMGKSYRPKAIGVESRVHTKTVLFVEALADIEKG